MTAAVRARSTFLSIPVRIWMLYVRTTRRPAGWACRPMESDGRAAPRMKSKDFVRMPTLLFHLLDHNIRTTGIRRRGGSKIRLQVDNEVEVSVRRDVVTLHTTAGRPARDDAAATKSRLSVSKARTGSGNCG